MRRPEPAGLRIEPCRAEEDLARLAALWLQSEPEGARSLEELLHERALAPTIREHLAWLGDEAVGAAIAGPFYSRPPDYPGAWTTVMVREDARRQGIGSALLAVNAREARALGKTAMYVFASEGRPESIAFLQRRGFVEQDRSKTVALTLAGLGAPAPAPPAGVAITTLAERPDLARGIYEVALEAMPDIPESEPTEPVEYEEWRAFTLDAPGTPPQACFVALADGEAIGWASLGLAGARPGYARHEMTGVKRAWRGRGVATALKRAAIAWAVGAGLEVLETENDEANAPMRAVNARLGYEPLPDLLLMRAPLPAA
jgi:GNAT superfamily N-acetyltransferase